MTVIITCVDPRVTKLTETSLGLTPGEAFIIRVAGGSFRSDGEVMQSLRLLVDQFDIKRIYVLGHTDCRAAKVEGVSEQELVVRGVALLEKVSWLPKDISVFGGVVCLSTGNVMEVG